MASSLSESENTVKPFFSALISGLCGKEKGERVQNKVILLHKGMWPNFFLHFLDRKIEKSLRNAKRYSHIKGSQPHGL